MDPRQLTAVPPASADSRPSRARLIRAITGEYEPPQRPKGEH